MRKSFASLSIVQHIAFRLPLLLFVFALCSAGCRGGRMIVASEIPSGVSNEYILRPGDQVSMEVFREPNLSGTFRLDPTGSIRHPVFGTIAIAGMTAADAERQLTALLADRYLVNPRVMISVVASQASQIVILGEVKKPGVHAIPFDKPMSLLQAVAEAGGFTDLASINRVQIVRGRDGRQKKIRVRISRIMDGSEPDFRLEPNDVIMVPQTVF